MAVLLEKLKSLFSSSATAAVNEKGLPSYIRSEDPESCWLTSDFIGDGAYGKIYKVYCLDDIFWTEYMNFRLVAGAGLLCNEVHLF